MPGHLSRKKLAHFTISISVGTLGFWNAMPSDAAPADRYKEFIQHPPSITDLFVEHRDAGQASSFYFAKWQTGCFFVACAPGETGGAFQEITNLADFEMIFSKYHSVYWQKTGSDLYSWTNLDLPKQQTNSITGSCQNFCQAVLTPILNGGCDFMPIGSISWVGDTFSYRSKDMDYWAKGILNRDRSGRAANLTIAIGKLGDPTPYGRHYSFDYYYDAALSLPFLPSRIERHYVDDNGKEWTHTVIIHEIRISQKPMNESAFSLEPLADTTNITDIITESNNLFVTLVKDAKPGVIAFGFRQDPSAPNLQTDFRRVYFRIAVLILVLIPIFYVPIYYFNRNRLIKSNTNNTKTKA